MHNQIRERNFWPRDVAVASVPPCSFLRAFGSKNGGPEATATVFGQLTGGFPIQLYINRVTSFFHPNLQMAIQLSPAPKG